MGVNNGGILNYDCDSVLDITQCTSGWKYSDHGWKDDNTFAVTCQGNKKLNIWKYGLLSFYEQYFKTFINTFYNIVETRVC